MYVPPPPPPPPDTTRIKLKSLAQEQERHLRNFADIKVIEQVNTAIRSALGDLLRAIPKPIQTHAGKNVSFLEPSNKFSSPITEARYLIDLADDAQHSP